MTDRKHLLLYGGLVKQLERDIRNQVVIDQMKQLNRRQRTMIYARKNFINLLFLLTALAWIIACITVVHAQDIPTGSGLTSKPPLTCPTPGEPCKILILSPQEERMLMGPAGILDTAAQARALDLGQFAVYLKTRIAAAPAGEVIAQKGDKEKPAAPVDSTPK